MRNYLKKLTSQRDESGATSVEFALIVGFLLLFIFIGIDLLYLSYKTLSLQYSASSILREAVVGEPETPPAGYSHADFMTQKIKERAALFGLTLEDNRVKICPLSDPQCSDNSTASSDDLIIISLEYDTSVLFMRDYTISAVAIGKNEPF